MSNAYRSEKSFASGMNFYKLAWVFLVCSVVGYAFEGIYWRVAYGFFESRPGLLYGPISQVYGCSAIVMLLVLKRLKINKSFSIFAVSYIVGAAFELCFGILQRAVFGFSSWYYGPEKLGLFERTSLLYSLIWGVMGLLLIKWIYPRLSVAVEKIPNRIGLFITWMIIVFLALDVAISAAAVYRAHQRLHDIPASNQAQYLLDRYYPDALIGERYPQLLRKHHKSR